MANFCPNCGTPVHESTLYCPNCGRSLTPFRPTEAYYTPLYKEKDPDTTVVLAVVLGLIGIMGGRASLPGKGYQRHHPSHSGLGDPAHDWIVLSISHCVRGVQHLLDRGTCDHFHSGMAGIADMASIRRKSVGQGIQPEHSNHW